MSQSSVEPKVEDKGKSEVDDLQPAWITPAVTVLDLETAQQTGGGIPG